MQLLRNKEGNITPLGEIILKICIAFAGFFYDKKYLKGRYFNNCFTGIKWVLRGIIFQKILGYNRNISFPCSFIISISNSDNIDFHPNDLNNFQSPGCYFQNFAGHITIGEGTYIAPNVGIITANHNIYDLDKHCEGKDVIIGKKYWLGMNSVILPGVALGDDTIVGAGAIVTKSFPEGKVVIAGNPAQIIKKI